MKKLIIILITILILSGCEAEIDAITDYISYFVNIEPSKTIGTENTEFTFKVKTNDVVTEWIFDGVSEPVTRSVSTKKFLEGVHTIEAVTKNKATDKVEVIVSKVGVVYRLSAVNRDETTPLEINYPTLTVDEVDYNIETMESSPGISVTETEEQRIISLSIEVDNYDSFYFINNNALDLQGIDLQNMSYSDMEKMILLLKKDDPMSTIPEYTSTIFCLTGKTIPVSDYLLVYDDKLQAGDDTLIYSDYATYADNIRTVSLAVNIDKHDDFLFINTNMQDFFGIDLSAMSYDEFVNATQIINRFPEEGIRELQEDY